MKHRLGAVVPEADVGDGVSFEENSLVLDVTLLDCLRERLFQHFFDVFGLIMGFDSFAFIGSFHHADQLLIFPEHLDVLENEAILLRVHDVGDRYLVVHLGQFLLLVSLRPEFLGKRGERAQFLLVAAREGHAVDWGALTVGSDCGQFLLCSVGWIHVHRLAALAHANVVVFNYHKFRYQSLFLFLA